MDTGAANTPRRPWLSATALAWVVFAVALVVFLVQSRHLTKPGYEHIRERSFLLGGDEPWYLLTTRSIALDLDYNLYNDRAEQEFWDKDIAEWSSAERLMRIGHGRTKTPEYWERRVYPVRPIGLPIVLAPAYRIGLLWDEQVRLTCVWLLCVVGALLVQQVFLMAYELTSNRVVAAFAALAGGFSVPIVVYVTQIYMDLPAAFLVVVACRMLFTAKGAPLVRAILAGCCAAYLPWLHEKFNPLTIVLLVAFVVAWRPWRPAASWKLKHAVGFYAPVVVSFALLAAYYSTVYGVPYPVYDHQEALTPATGLRSGYLGLLFDRTDGLLPYWPVLAFAIVGLVFMLRDRQRVAPWLIVLCAVPWLVYGMYPDWMGGRAAPVRYMLPAMPFLIVGSAYALARMRRWWLVGLAGLALFAGVVIGARNISHPRALAKDSLPLVPSEGTFAVRHIERFYNLFPDMKCLGDDRKPTAGDTARGVAWLVALAGFVVLIVWLERRPIKDDNTDDTTHDEPERADNNG